MLRVCFVCLGNICRSPLAEGLFRHHVTQAGLQADFEIDSAGTGGWHVGEAPDRRSVEVARRHGLDISHQSARKFVAADLDRFDHVVAMDASNLSNIRRLGSGRAAVTMLLDETGGGEVPDPYYGAGDGFERVYTMVDAACAALLERLRS